MIRRFYLIAVMLFFAALVLGTGCKPKSESNESTEDLSASSASEEDTRDGDVPEDEHAAAQVGDDQAEPVIELNAPDNALLGGQGLRNPQEDPQDEADSGLKLQLGGGSGYGYQRNRPSLLND